MDVDLDKLTQSELERITETLEEALNFVLSDSRNPKRRKQLIAALHDRLDALTMTAAEPEYDSM